MMGSQLQWNKLFHYLKIVILFILSLHSSRLNNLNPFSLSTISLFLKYFIIFVCPLDLFQFIHIVHLPCSNPARSLWPVFTLVFLAMYRPGDKGAAERVGSGQSVSGVIYSPVSYSWDKNGDQ